MDYKPSQVFDHLKYNVSLDSYLYVLDKTCKLHPVQLELINYTQKNVARATMQSAPDQCQFFSFLLKIINAKKIVDVGVFTGLSTLNFALAVPDDGKVIGCDVSTEFTDIAKPYWKKAGVDHKIDLRIQPAVKTLQELVEKEAGTFDFVFIDADKTSYVDYYELALQLVRKGGIIAIDNTLYGGSVVNPSIDEPNANTIRKLNDIISNDKRIVQSFLPIADGVTLVTKA
eukprot:gene595-741_t